MAQRLIDEYPEIENFSLGKGTEPLLIVPVPLTQARTQERGYNQAEELAYSMRRALQNAGVRCVLDTQTLCKRRDTHMQKHCDKFLDNSPTASLSYDTARFIDYAIELNDEKLNDFLIKYGAQPIDWQIENV